MDGKSFSTWCFQFPGTLLHPCLHNSTQHDANHNLECDPGMTARVNFPFWKSSPYAHPNFSPGAGRGGQPEQTSVVLHTSIIVLPVFSLLILQGSNHPAAAYKSLVRRAVRRRNGKTNRPASSLSSLFSFLHCKPWGASNFSYHDHFSYDKRLRFPSEGDSDTRNLSGCSPASGRKRILSSPCDVFVLLGSTARITSGNSWTSWTQIVSLHSFCRTKITPDTGFLNWLISKHFSSPIVCWWTLN